jgi:hypothetical protein
MVLGFGVLAQDASSTASTVLHMGSRVRLRDALR